MNKTDKLLDRLHAIGQALEASGRGLALIGLGSVGLERSRLDDYSDLDFFAIVAPGHKTDFISHLGWLADIHPIAYAFQNTDDGYKLLYTDGIFCEFAVFEPDELSHIPFAQGAIIWQAAGFDSALAAPQPNTPSTSHSPHWHLGELLTNLYVGMARYRRGEKLSAQRFVEQYALDRLLALAPEIETPAPGFADPFGRERRFEQRYPGIAAYLPQFMQGYERVPESARALLAYVERHFEVNPGMKAVILELCGE